MGCGVREDPGHGRRRMTDSTGTTTPPTAGEDPATWDEALEAIEQQLAATEAALLEGDDVPDVEWNLPDDLGAMPPSAAPWAGGLLERTEQVQTEIDQRMTRLKSELGALKHRRGALTAYVSADVDGRETHTG